MLPSAARATIVAALCGLVLAAMFVASVPLFEQRAYIPISGLVGAFVGAGMIVVAVYTFAIRFAALFAGLTIVQL